MPAYILFVDDNDSAMTNLPKKFHAKFNLRYTSSYKKALAILKSDEQCGLLISELGLNNEDGITFLRTIRKFYPKTIRMVMTASTTFSDAFDALNSAQASRFIQKPCPADTLTKIIIHGMQLYEEALQKQQAMRKALLGSVNALVDILDLVNPEAMGFSKRIRNRVMKTGKALGIKRLWQLELAVMLSHIGCVALPSEIMEKMDQGKKLSPEEQQIFGMHPSIASNLLANIDQMSTVAEIISHQHDFLTPDQPLESRIIKIALDLDRLERKGNTPLAILDKMRTKPKAYDPKVVETMAKLLANRNTKSVYQLNIEELKEGMIMAKDMINKDGVKLLLRGQPISKASLIRLKAFHIALGIIEPIHVLAEELAATI
ncbi:MAG: response regulator [Pseudodesulfovibrio sp.]|nr:response regulator [Pseudodesulfovibrio sp.]